MIVRPLKSKVQPEKKVDIGKTDEEKEEEKEEFQIDLDSDFQATINFEEVKNKLKNIILDPASTRILGGQSFFNIPQKISYCVGVST